VLRDEALVLGTRLWFMAKPWVTYVR